MDDVSRGGRLLLSRAAFGIVALVLVACERPAESPAGVSSAKPSLTVPPVDAGVRTPPTLAILPADFRAKYTKLSTARFVSAGHASGRFEVEVYANASGAERAGGNQTAPFPQGAVFVEEHWEKTPEGARPGPLMAMEKMPAGYDAERGDWRYVVVGSDGNVLTDGKPDGCVLCHDDAPHDRIFSVPRSTVK